MQAKKLWQKGYPIAILTIIVAICVTAIVFTHRITEAKIKAQGDEGVRVMLNQLFPEMTRYEFNNDIYTVYADGSLDGYAFIATGQGYGGEITILVGLEDENTIKGINIISQTETPGLGTRVTEPSFTEQFSGVGINDVALSRDGGQIDGISGATISSRAVVNAVRETALQKVQALKDSGG